MAFHLTDEQELLAKVAKGDAGAFKVVYEAYYNRIYGFAIRILHSSELAQEVVQESMLKIWQLGHKLKEIRNLESYLKTVCRHCALDILRRRELEAQRVRALTATWNDAHNSTEEDLLENETRVILEEGVCLLPKQQRIVFQLCHQEGLTYEQAARQLNISHGTVQTHGFCRVVADLTNFLNF